MQTLFTPPAQNKRLAADVSDIPFLREDASAEVTLLAESMTGCRTGVEGGWEPDKVVQAFVERDLSILIGNHTGLLSVQLQDRSRNAAVAEPGAPVGENVLPEGDAPSMPMPMPAAPAKPPKTPPAASNGSGKIHKELEPYVPA
jgi:hypothetical protein